MPVSTIKSNRNIIAFSLVSLSVFGMGMLTLRLIPIVLKDRIATAFLADFVITVPALYYLVVLRRSKASLKRLFLVLSICCGLAYVILPQHQRDLILQIRKVTLLAEVGFVVYAITKLTKLRAAYRAEQAVFADPIYNLRSAMVKIMGESVGVKVIASELAIMRYGLFFWKKEKPVGGVISTYTTYKDFGYFAVWCILLCAVLVELFAVHLVLMRYSHIAAITVSVLTGYGLVLVVADLAAMLKREILIFDDQIVLRTGLRWRAITGNGNIKSVKYISNDYQSDEVYFKGGQTKNSGNIEIIFINPVTIEKLYGNNVLHDIILMNVDDAKAFVDRLDPQPF